MTAKKMSNIDLRSVIGWLESQDDTQAHCAKRIIESKSFNNIRFHLSEITDWLASKAQTSKNAGQAYFLVTEIASNIHLISS
jgi:hypothetical protein